MIGPSFTARGVAQVRDRLDRPHPGDGDPDGAHRLARDISIPLPLHLSRTFSRYLGARTRFFDEEVLAACTHADAQIVILGAGYDDRALRFRRPGVQFVEVDHPDTQRDKLARLQRLDIASDDIAFLSVDFLEDDLARALRGVVSSSRPTLFLCEGLVPYLPRRAVEQLLRHAAAGPGTPLRLAVELPVRPTTGAGRLTIRMLGIATSTSGERIRTVFEDDPDAQHAVAQAGWRVEDWRRGSDLGMPRVTGDVVYATAIR